MAQLEYGWSMEHFFSFEFPIREVCRIYATQTSVIRLQGVLAAVGTPEPCNLRPYVRSSRSVPCSLRPYVCSLRPYVCSSRSPAMCFLLCQQHSMMLHATMWHRALQGWSIKTSEKLSKNHLSPIRYVCPHMPPRRLSEICQV